MLYLKESNLTQLLVSDPVSVFYYTGYRCFPGERFFALLLSEGETPTLFLNRLFPEEREKGLRIVRLDDTDAPVDILRPYIKKQEALAVDKQLTAGFLLPLIRAELAAGFIDGSFAVEKSRAVKDEAEQEAMILSSEINDAAMERFRLLIRPGVTEAQIASAIPAVYKSCGADKTDFAIVSFGKNAADPHHMPDDTELAPGDCVLLDVGAVKNGYCSDMTRTFFFRSAGEKQREVYEIVKRANEAAERFVRPGVRFSEIDRAARSIIEESGYGDFFTHRLGHSIGLQGHECGDVSAANDDFVEEGMTFSIEPGIYLPGEFGIRIEDLVLVTKNGCRVLNAYEKNLCVVGG